MDDESKDAVLRERMARIRRGYIDKLRAQAGELEELIVRAESEEPVDDEVRQVVHRLAGTAGSFDFDRISDAANELEQELVGGAPLIERIDDLRDLIEMLRTTESG